MNTTYTHLCQVQIAKGHQNTRLLSNKEEETMGMAVHLGQQPAIDPQFYAGMQMIASVKKYPVKIAQETVKWARAASFLSKPYLSQLENVSSLLKESGTLLSRAFILTDVISLGHSTLKLPEKITASFDGFDGVSLSTLSQTANTAKLLFADTIAPFFRSAGFLISDLSDINIINLGEYTPLFNSGMSFLLVALSVKECIEAVHGYTYAKDDTLFDARLKCIEKSASCAAQVLLYTSFGGTPALAMTLLLLGTTKLIAKGVIDYMKSEKETPPEKTGEPLHISLDEPPLLTVGC